MTEMYRVDKMLDRLRDVECWHLLHRYAGMRNFSTVVKPSYIDRGSYFCEINKYLGNGKIVPNVAMGVGRHPMIAAIDGFRKAVPLDDQMAVIYLECETWLLSEAHRVTNRLEQVMHEIRMQNARIMLMLEIAIADE